MLATTLFSAVIFIIPVALADGAAIVSALSVIAVDTAALNNTVITWDGGLLGALPIVTESATLLKDINKATDIAKSSANLSLIETVNVAVATQALIQDVNLTLTTIIAAKPKFDHLLLSPVTLLNLELEKDATDKFSAVVASKVPAELVAAAQALAGQIDDEFDEAIGVYKHLL
ncbi:hypothetical protein NKR23_g8787 [Pleurostoma richardsiae]|uniref:Antigenic cell wall galactomannoprotein n=1 Tax=Pleurostoma richardsiae TaxID=41990 RepID=A0AA38RHM4_9PEZI|nr:hypothetical protein NKR23_g8787 [Pleurostoma richardsiae]